MHTETKPNMPYTIKWKFLTGENDLVLYEHVGKE